MINITQIFFFEDSDKHDDRGETTVAREIIRDEIWNTKMRNDFYRYLSWRIQTAPLKKKIVHRHKNFYITNFTNESWILIEKFIEYAVEVFNVSHPHASRTTVASTVRVLEEWWDYDYEDYLWDEEGKEPESAGREDICVLESFGQRKYDSTTISL